MAGETTDSPVKGVTTSTPLSESRSRSETRYLASGITNEYGTLNKEFSLSRATERTLAETVQRMYGIFSKEKFSTLGGANYDTRAIMKMVELFNKSNPGITPDDPKMEEKAFAFIRSSPQAATLAIKLAEWELATIQRTTGAYIDGDVPEVRYNNPAVVVSVDDTKPRWSHRMSKWVESRRGHDPNLYYRVTYPNSDSVTYTANGIPAPGGPPLNIDLIQKKYLDAQFRANPNINSTMPFTGAQADAEKFRIANQLNAITQARYDFYKVIGRGEGVFEANVYDRNGRIKDMIQFSHLDVEHRIRQQYGGADAKQRIYREIGLLEQDIEKDINEKIKQGLAEAQKKRDDELLAPSLRVQKKSLESKRVPAPDAEKKRKELDEEKKKVDEELRKVNERSRLRKSINEGNVKATALTRTINEIVSRESGGDITNIVQLSETDIPKLTAEVGDLQRRFSEADTEYQAKCKLRDQLYEKRAETATGLTSGNDKIRDSVTEDLVKQDRIIKEVEDEIGRLKLKLDGDSSKTDQTEKDGLRKRFNDRNEILQNYRKYTEPEEVDELFKQLKKLKGQMTREEGEFGLIGDIETAIRARMPVPAAPAGGGAPPPITIAEIKEFLDKEGRRILNEIDNLSGTDIEEKYRLRAVDAYLEHMLGKDEQINNRVSDRKNIPFEGNYDIDAYGDYPKAYLRALQLLAGEQVLLASNKQMFIDVSSMLTPDLFDEIINGDVATPIDIFTLDPSAVSLSMMNNIRAKLRSEAYDGRLGRLSTNDAYREAEKERFNLIKSIPRATSEPDPALTQRYEKEIFYYRAGDNLEDLTLRIVVQMSVDDAQDYLDPANPNHASQIGRAKRYAETVHRKRKERLGINNESEATEVAPEEPVAPEPTPGTTP